MTEFVFQYVFIKNNTYFMCIYLQERHMGESLVEAMKPELRNKYLDLRNVNTSLLQHLDQMQHNLDTLDNRKASFEDELSMSKVNVASRCSEAL